MRRTRVLPLAALLLSTPALVGAVPASAAPGTPAGPLRILLTNDDGFDAVGIRTLFQRLTAAGYDVTIVAPLTNQSGTGTKMMSSTTLTVKHPEPRVWAVDGTPGDAVSFGLSEVFADRAPDLVVSGTNFGPNLAAHRHRRLHRQAHRTSQGPRDERAVAARGSGPERQPPGGRSRRQGDRPRCLPHDAGSAARPEGGLHRLR